MNINELKEELKITINYERKKQEVFKDSKEAEALAYKIAFLLLQLKVFDDLSEEEVKMLQNNNYFNKYTIYDYVNGKLFENFSHVDFFEYEANKNFSIKTLSI